MNELLNETSKVNSEEIGEKIEAAVELSKEIDGSSSVDEKADDTSEVTSEKANDEETIESSRSTPDFLSMFGIKAENREDGTVITDEERSSLKSANDETHEIVDTCETPPKSAMEQPWEEELKTCDGLGEKVKFLKEQGLTFRLISERLNVPMTNCYTAIKKLRLPQEYWDKMKAEMRIRKRQQEAIEEGRHPEILSDTSVIPRKRLSKSINDDENGFSSILSMSSANGSAGSPEKNTTMSGRKHLTLEDGKVVQFWRDQGLTLQKIADKLQMPMSSCYRAMKRYQVTQKASQIIADKSTASVQNHDDEMLQLDENHFLPKSTSELLLGMVNASMSDLTSSLNQSDSIIARDTSMSTSSATAESPLPASKDDNFSARSLLVNDRRRGRFLNQNAIWNFVRNSTRSENTHCCILCGYELPFANVWSISQHLCSCHPERLSDSKSQEGQLPTMSSFMNNGTSNVISSNGIRPSPPATPSSSISPLPTPQDYTRMMLMIRNKLEWAAEQMAHSTNPEEIVGLMRVMSNGLEIMKQFGQRQLNVPTIV
ncbi:hypothetical protein AB6A40_002707 [Gnathostoma spinigerum]|uniref:BED-type domain-containing protein n=1 Tax=Gnathostoma spinigerum TaxID=75299 RepID=A0ABD6E7C7_9BILA